MRFKKTMGIRFDIPAAAFGPFYDTPVAICGKREGGRVLRGSCLACVFFDGYDDPISEASDGAERRTASVWVRRHGESAWFDVTPPRKGDRVTIDSMEYAAERVDMTDAGCYALKVREVAK